MILWNHRWEFDKSPELFARVIERLAARGLDFRLAILGEAGSNPSPALPRLMDVMPERIVQFGYAESRARYAELLWESAVVVSTTRHEFFGVGMVEALYCGCVPCTPKGFTYPELVPPAMHDACLFEGEADFEAKLERLLVDPPATDASRASASRFDWPVVGPLWDEALDEVGAEFATKRKTPGRSD